jgi:16S rRNA (guanine527-N7)-methyltransferase
MTPAQQLAEGIAALGFPVASAVQQKLIDFLALIGKWNRVYNLTAVRETEKMVSHHLLDSLAVAPHLGGDTVLDVGSGAGLPGIPLALVHPERRVTLLEANHKKSAFLQQAVIELGLGNATVVRERVETFEPGHRYDVVISRAFSDLAEFISLAGRHVRDGGTLAAMKGVYPHEELGQLPGGFRLSGVVPLAVPGMEAERHLVLLAPVR